MQIHFFLYKTKLEQIYIKSQELLQPINDYQFDEIDQLKLYTKKLN